MVRTKAVLRLALASVVAVGVAACDDGDDPAGVAEADLVTLAESSEDLESLTAAIVAADLEGALSGPGPFTVFAPADAAFDALPGGVLESLLESGNQDVLQELLGGHVVAGRYEAGDLSDGQVLTALSGDELAVSIDGSEVRIGGAPVQTADVSASNGVVHVIGSVLTEGLNVVERARITPELSALVTAVVEGGLAATLEGPGPFTVFAPVNTAFGAVDAEVLGRLLADQALLQKVLTYHVLPGAIRSTDLQEGTFATAEGTAVRIDLDGGATVNDIAITTTDIEVENGVIHLIDGVLLQHLDLVDVAVLNGFSDLVGAVQAAGLESALRDPGASLTVFAPTNAAFAAIAPVPSDPETLEPILLYHVVGTAAYAGDLSDGQELTTLQGGTVTVQISEETVTIAGAQNTPRVAATDIPASNGVIHVIDAVLLPPSD